MDPAEGVERTLAAATADERRALLDGLVALADDAPAEVRGRAAMLLAREADALGRGRMHALWVRSGAAFAALPTPDEGRTVEVAVLQALLVDDPAADVLDRARTLIEAGQGSWLLSGVARHDADWVLSRVPGVFDDGAASPFALLLGLTRRDDRLALIGRLDADQRRALADSLDGFLARARLDEDERTALLARLG